jgi:Tol biopolymer transport system component
MGEVYRARDVRLERDVAIKVLPANLSSDACLKQRLEREAKAVSKLSHPHICTLHDIGHQDGVDFLVMEYLEGETLEQRLIKGPLPPGQTLRYASQIADALAKAHKLGITHRDLKPANVMLTKSGAKLMDFGLAKQSSVAPLANALTEMTVDQAKLTSQDTIVGTFQYMAPEQLEGKEADARTDIFACGELIHEMATGRPAFSGKSRASLIAAILTAEPPAITQLQPLTPLALERVVKKCLAKDPDERWQSASDLASELKWMEEGGSQTGVSGVAAVTHGVSWRRMAPWGLTALLLAALVSLGWRRYSARGSDSAAVARLTMTLPSKITFGPAAWPEFAIAPDGTNVVVVGTAEDGVTRLYLRKIDQWDATAIEDTEGATKPFFSPDGSWVAFNVGNRMKKVSIVGGPATDLAPSEWGGGSWGLNDQIVFTKSYNEGLWKVSAGGGTPTLVTSPDRSKGELAHWWPQILPDGDTVVFTSFSSPIERSRILSRSLNSGQQKTLIEDGVFGRYMAPGYLVFARGETVFAVPFDAKRAKVMGAPVPVLENVASYPQNGVSHFAVSDSGALAFLPSSFVFTKQKLVSIDRKGKVQVIRENLHTHGGIRLSPEGRRLALALRESGHAPDIWIQDLTRGTLSRLTHGPSSNFAPLWLPDGKRILYTSERPIFDLYIASADGSGGEEAFLTTSNDKYAQTISPNGKTLIFSPSVPGNDNDLWSGPLETIRDAKPFLATAFYECEASFSPDGRWIAYVSDESGKREVYVRDFPAGGTRFQVSTHGGDDPVWSRNGKEIFYLEGKKLMTVPVQTTPSFVPGTPATLFDRGFEASDLNTPSYDVSPDGQLFYLAQQESLTQPEASIKLVLHWPEELKHLVQPRRP